MEKDYTYVVETVLLGKEDTLHILLFRYHVLRNSVSICVSITEYTLNRHTQLNLNYKVVNSEVF